MVSVKNYSFNVINKVMDGQDWKPVIWTKDNKMKNNKHTHADPTYVKWKKLDDDDHHGMKRSSVVKKTIEYGKQIVRNRTKLNMTQFMLATKLNIPIHRLKKIETGEERASDKLRNDLNRIFRDSGGPV